MKKRLLFLIVRITALNLFSSLPIHAAVELPTINTAASKKLYKAAQKGNLERAQQALKEGADINMYVQYKHLDIHHVYNLPYQTPLSAAIQKGNLDMVKFLLHHNASVDARITSDTPLLTVPRLKHRFQATALVTELLRYKANVNAQNSFLEYTPLMRAIKHLKNESMVKCLILAGADITLTNFKHKTAWNMIKKPAIREAFLEACAINEEAFRHLEILKVIVRSKIHQDSYLTIPHLTLLIADYAVPYYTSHDADQPAYDMLNERIAEKWAHIKTKLKPTKRLAVHYLTEKNDANNKNSQKCICLSVEC